MNNNGYSLISEYNGVKTIVKIKQYDEKKKEFVLKDKVGLFTIDLFTSNFTTEEECDLYLGLPKDSKLCINYQSNKVINELPCVFNDNSLVRYFADIYTINNNIPIKDKYFRKLVNKFFVSICRPSVKNYIMNDYRINSYIKDKINEYLQFNQDEIFILKKLQTELQNYKNLRSVILSILSYERENGIKIFDFSVPIIEEQPIERNIDIMISDFIPTDDYEEPIFPPNSEEERKYNEYLESLPDEYSCHDYKRLTKKS